MVHVKANNVKGKKNQEKYKVTGLKLQEYVFDGVTQNKYTSKEE